MGPPLQQGRVLSLAYALYGASVAGVEALNLYDAVPGPVVASVHREAVFAVNITTGVPYGKALYCTAANFSQTNCTTIELLLDVLRPVVNASTRVPLPTGPMPVMMGIHGGSYSHGDSSEEHTNVAYFVQRGWMGFSINYRLCNQRPYVHPSGDSIFGSAGPDMQSVGNLVCSQFGSFPTQPPYGNATCTAADVKTFGLGTVDGCPLSSPPKLAANSTGHGRPGSFFGTLMAWVRTIGGCTQYFRIIMNIVLWSPIVQRTSDVPRTALTNHSHGCCGACLMCVVDIIIDVPSHARRKGRSALDPRER